MISSRRRKKCDLTSKECIFQLTVLYYIKIENKHIFQKAGKEFSSVIFDIIDKICRFCYLFIFLSNYTS